MRAFTTVEPLESRIAPAMVLTPPVVIASNGHSATFTDVDGDHVTVSVSAGALTLGDFTTVAAGLGEQLQRLDLSGSAFAGANVTVAVVRAPTGDGLIDVGEIHAPGRDLGSVKINGDLGSIVAGSGTAGKAAIKSLAVDSLGELGTSSQAFGGSLESDITGALGGLTVKHDILEAYVKVTGSIGSVKIGGSLIGGAATHSGLIKAWGDIGPVKIGSDIVGGGGVSESGGIDSAGAMKGVTVGHSIIGGSGAGNYSGFLFATRDISNVKIGGDLLGGSEADSGEITTAGNLKSLSIGGSMRGNVGTSSAFILANEIGSVKIGRDLEGGQGIGSGKIVSTGSSAGTGEIASLLIGGSVIGGIGAGSGSIVSTANMGTMKIGGNLTGGPANDAGVIECGATLVNVTLKGSLIGGSSVTGATIAHTGMISAVALLANVTIGGDIFGGSAANHSSLHESGVLLGSNPALTTGSVGRVTVKGSIIQGYIENSSSSSSATFIAGIFAPGDIGFVTVKHDIIGGFIGANGNLAGVSLGGSLEGQSIVNGVGYSMNGFIGAHGNIGPVTIGGNVIGGNADGSTFTETGCIAGGHLASVSIRGSLIAGVSTNGSTLTLSGAVVSENDIVALSIGGDVIGNKTERAEIVARGQAVQGATTDVAIGSVKIGGRVEMGDIVAGYSPSTGVASNADAQIGAVKVGGSWIASNLLAGAKNSGSPNFGDANDAPIAVGKAAILSKIASLTIGGPVYGTPSSQSSTDSYGFVAEAIGAVKINGVALTPSPGPSNNHILVSVTGDVYLHVIA